MKWNSTRVLALLIAPMLVVSSATGELLQRKPFRAGVGPGGNVNLPYVVADNSGNQWRIYAGGMMQQSGNMPLYSQGAMLTINGNQPNMNQNAARLDAETSEVVFDNMQVMGFVLTRR